jgi:hypothetical protein
MTKKEEKLCDEYLDLAAEYDRKGIKEKERSEIFLKMKSIHEKLSDKGRKYVSRILESIHYEG